MENKMHINFYKGTSHVVLPPFQGLFLFFLPAGGFAPVCVLMPLRGYSSVVLCPYGAIRLCYNAPTGLFVCVLMALRGSSSVFLWPYGAIRLCSYAPTGLFVGVLMPLRGLTIRASRLREHRLLLQSA